MPIPHPIPVPHPVTLTKAIFVPVPKTIPIPQSSHDEGGISAEGGGDHSSHETINYSTYTSQGHEAYDQQNSDQQAQFQPSQSNSADH